MTRIALRFFLLPYLCLVLPTAVRAEIGFSALTERSGVTYQGDRPFTGTAVERYPSGVIYRELQYKNGHQEGATREFALNGKLHAVWNFSRGKKDGLQQGWYAEGPKEFEFHYQNGRPHGLQTEWHLNGTVFKQQNFVRGVEVSKKILYQQGNVFSNYTKKDGRTYGIDGGALCFEKKKDGEK